MPSDGNPLQASQIEKYQIIDRLKIDYPVSRVCRVLNIVRRSYYKWVEKGKPIANNFNESISKIISEEHNYLKSIYGTIRLKYHIQNKYQKEGLILNHKLIRRYKNILGLETIKRSKKGLSVIRAKEKNLKKKAQCLIGCNFNSDVFGQKQSSDVSYIKCKDGTLYLSAIKDYFNNENFDEVFYQNMIAYCKTGNEKYVEIFKQYEIKKEQEKQMKIEEEIEKIKVIKSYLPNLNKQIKLFNYKIIEEDKNFYIIDLTDNIFLELECNEYAEDYSYVHENKLEISFYVRDERVELKLIKNVDNYNLDLFYSQQGKHNFMIVSLSHNNQEEKEMAITISNDKIGARYSYELDTGLLEIEKEIEYNQFRIKDKNNLDLVRFVLDHMKKIVPSTYDFLINHEFLNCELQKLLLKKYISQNDNPKISGNKLKILSIMKRSNR